MAPENVQPKDLASPIKSVRLLALERAYFAGASSELLAALRVREIHENDPECRLMLGHAIRAVRGRLGQGDVAPTAPLSSADWATRFAAANPGGRQELLGDLDESGKSALAAQVPTLLAAEQDPVVAASLIRVFHDCWPPERRDLLVARLSHPEETVRLASLHALVQTAPKLLEGHLPEFLNSLQAEVRGMAVRGLLAIDPAEGRAHLSEMLLSPDPYHRQAALPLSLLLPFPQVKSLILNFISVEKDLELIDRAAHLLQINPDPETPFRLWEIVEVSSQEKSDRLKVAVAGVCKAIEGFQLLGESYAAYREQLQNWIYRRAATRFVQDCLARLAQEEGTPGADPATGISKGLVNPHIRAAFVEAWDWPLPEGVRERLGALLPPDLLPTAGATAGLPADARRETHDLVPGGVPEPPSASVASPPGAGRKPEPPPVEGLGEGVPGPALPGTLRESPLSAPPTETVPPLPPPPRPADKPALRVAAHPSRPTAAVRTATTKPPPAPGDAPTSVWEKAGSRLPGESPGWSPAQARPPRPEPRPGDSRARVPGTPPIPTSRPGESHRRDAGADVPAPVPPPPPQPPVDGLLPRLLRDSGEMAVLVKLGEWEKGDPVQVRPELAALMADPECSPKLLTAVLRVALALGIGDFSVPVRTCLRNVHEPLVVLTLDYLARFDGEWLHGQLSPFLKSTRVRIMAAAVKALQQIDSAAALSHLFGLLANRDPTQVKMALGTMIHLDFSLLRDRLTDFLIENPAKEIIQPALCLFQANPDPESLFCLYRLEKSLPIGKSSSVGEIRQKVVQLLIKYGRLSSTRAPDIERELENRWQTYLTTADAPTPAYSLRKMRPRSAQPPAAPPPEKGAPVPAKTRVSLDLTPEQMKMAGGVAGGLAACLFVGWLLFGGGDALPTPPDEPTRPPPVETASGTTHTSVRDSLSLTSEVPASATPEEIDEYYRRKREEALRGGDGH